MCKIRSENGQAVDVVSPRSSLTKLGKIKVHSVSDT